MNGASYFDNNVESVPYACKNGIRNQYHMRTAHRIEIYSYKDLWDDIKRTHKVMEDKQKKKNPLKCVPRAQFLDYWKPRMRFIAEDTTKKFNSRLMDFTFK